MGTEEEIVRDSNPNASGPDGAAGGMGVSSERVGPTGPGQVGTDGTRDVTPREGAGVDPGDPDDPGDPGDPDPGGDEPPEQRPGNPEYNPEGLRPKSGYSSADPRSD